MAYKRSRKDFEADLQKQESPFVVYGTPLPPLDEGTRDDGSYVPVWKQEVTDDRGRKRLHGAFTGGFSAGYFNTVGSKEGWTPSTFVSSRSNRAKDKKDAAQQQRPEDFMDEEDVREQDEARQLSTADAYAGFGTEDDPMHKNSLMDLFRPTEDSMGVKLLQKMGWKQGQGIGPRVRRKAGADDDSSETHLFAPDDVPMISFIKKSDFKGLGYDAEPSLEVSSKQKTISAWKTSRPENADADEDGRPGLSFAGHAKSKKKLGRTSMGVGILNDTGSDEEDAYSMGPKISYNRTLGGDKKQKKKQNASVGGANPLLKTKPVFVSKKLASMQNALRKCHDGRLPLSGFVLADQLDSFSSMSLSDDRYKPPEVPVDWKPANAQDDEAESEQQAKYQSTADAAKASTHSSVSRGNLLGEARLPGKSIFDFLTPAAREKLVKATGKSNLPPALSEQLAGATSAPQQETKIDIPYLDSSTALSALSRSASGGFIPYAEDLSKRERYKFFLEIAAGLHPPGTLPNKPPPAEGGDGKLHEQDWLNEVHEFVRAAEVFRPMTGAIASRFTSSSSIQPSSEGVRHEAGEQDKLLRNPASKPENPAEVAAKLGMFGLMTRSYTLFQPTRLVCKRFGVDMPVATDLPSYFAPAAAAAATPPANTTQSPGPQHYTPSADSSRTVHNTSSKFQSAGFITDGKEQQNPIEDTNTSLPAKSVGTEDQNMNNGNTIDPDKNEALEAERPGQAVFKAIFGDSDSDSDDDDDT